MFRGTHRHNLDSKGRMNVPARFRDWLNAHCDGQIVVTIDVQSRPGEHCLVAYPLPTWEKVEARVAELPGNNPAARQFQRMFVGQSEEMRLDSQARILLSPNLRRFAEIDKELVVVGQINKFEIWDAQCWDRYQENSLNNNDGFASLGDLIL
ncbi:MAG: division/cell wall cluster transcriptional repressor MraZ [Acidithiobacillus sp.]|nr:division/cell wall cluster transcriptional repressor MraZ [Acidithiobacillus sp.]MDD5278445.1 division/cell wall cluster transcriptional repressor MraZ [Acidithiobacillus sp.]